MDVEGSLDNIESSALEEAFNKLFGENKNKILCNMHEVSYVGPVAMKILIENTKKALDVGGAVKLCAIRSDLRRIFEFAGFDNSKTFYQGWKEAIKEFSHEKPRNAYKRTTQIRNPLFSKDTSDTDEDTFNPTIVSGTPPKLPFKGIPGKEDNLDGDDLYNPTVVSHEAPSVLDSLKETKEETPDENPYGATIQMKESPWQKNVEKVEEDYGLAFQNEAPKKETKKRTKGPVELLNDKDFLAGDDDDDPLGDIFAEDEKE